ncbi:MAG: ABC transporter permease [Actinomycetota bacterium]
MNKALKKIGNFLIEQKLLFVIIILVIALSSADRSFFSLRSLLSILDHITLLGIMAAGMTVLLISGWFDLSVGAVMAFTGVIIVLLQPYGMLVSIIGGLLAGTLVGAINGLLVVKGRIHAFIATLGTMIIFRGLSLGLTEARPIRGTIDAFKLVGRGAIMWIPNTVLFLIITYVAVWYILKYTKFGRNDYAIGGNIDSARLAGINVNAFTFLYFVFCSFTAAFAGMVYTSTVNTASAVYGPGIELYVIAAAVLGGTSLFGGKGNVVGSFQGAIILGLIDRSMVIFRVDTNYQLLIRGLIILAVVVTDAIVSRREEIKLLARGGD